MLHRILVTVLSDTFQHCDMAWHCTCNGGVCSQQLLSRDSSCPVACIVVMLYTRYEVLKDVVAPQLLQQVQQLQHVHSSNQHATQLAAQLAGLRAIARTALLPAIQDEEKKNSGTQPSHGELFAVSPLAVVEHTRSCSI